MHVNQLWLLDYGRIQLRVRVGGELTIDSLAYMHDDYRVLESGGT